MGARSFGSGRIAFTCGGGTAGFVKSVDGGNISGEVVKHNVVGMYQKKNLATIKHEPIKVETGLGKQSKDLCDWMTASLNAAHTRNDGAIMNADFDYKVKSRRDFFDALITEIAFPKMDASSKDAAYITVTMDPERIRYMPGDDSVLDAPADVSTKKWLCSNFRVVIGDLPCTRISSFTLGTWKQTVAVDEVGSFREPTKEPCAIEVPDIEFECSMADIGPFQELHKSFVIDGKCSDSDELDGSVEFLGPDLQEVLGTVSLFGLGMISLNSSKGTNNEAKVQRFTVKMYCERMSLEIA